MDIKDQYGDMVFYNHQKTKNLMNDLAPGLRKERIHVNQFLELNGYFQLKHAAHSYPIVRTRLIQNYINTYAVHESVAVWILDVFSYLLGYDDFMNIKTTIKRPESRLVSTVNPEPIPEERESAEKKPNEKGLKERELEKKGSEERESKEIEIEKELESEERESKEKESESKESESNEKDLAKKGSVNNKSPKKKNPTPQKKQDILQPVTHKPVTHKPVTHEPVIQKPAIQTPLTIPQQEYHKKPIDLKTRISADMHTAAVMPDGKVRAVGPNNYGQCDVDKWHDIIAVSCGPFFTVGLKENGRVVATGRNEFGRCSVSSWRDIAAISAGPRHTVGLRTDGTVLATGQNKRGECNVGKWRDIVHVSAGYMCTFGIKKDGKVLVVGSIKENDMQHLTNTLDIVNPYPFRTLALMKNGRLAALGQENTLKNSIAKWRGILQISAGPDYFAGLFKGGSVRILAYYWLSSGIERTPMDWRDIAAIAAGRFHLLGVKKDGSIVSAMMHPSKDMDKGQCKVMDWNLL